MKLPTTTFDLSRLRQGGALVVAPLAAPAKPGLMQYVFASSDERENLRRRTQAAQTVEVEQIEAATRVAVVTIANKEASALMRLDEEDRTARTEAEHRLAQDQAMAEQASGKLVTDVAIAVTVEAAETDKRVNAMAASGQISREDAEMLAEVNALVKQTAIQGAVDRFQMTLKARQSRVQGVLAPRDREGGL